MGLRVIRETWLVSLISLFMIWLVIRVVIAVAVYQVRLDHDSKLTHLINI